MSDPRFGGSHLDVARHDQYDASVDELLDSRGPATSDYDPLVRRPSAPRPPSRHGSPLPGGTYTLVGMADGRRHSLRTGLNAVGRFRENDVVLEPNWVSRRHCVVTVHATGPCEVCDTASRNGTWVNGRRVARAWLQPGDELCICSERFVVVWVGPDGELFESDAAGSETDRLGAPSSTA